MVRVLVIEDNIDINETTTEMLELAGYEVITASDGEEGIVKAKSELPEIILCDILMPKVGGFEVISELKNSSETEEIPFIFFSASTEKSAINQANELGASGFICKPFSEELLLKTIESALLDSLSEN